jgi:hypothetical protein
MLYEINGIGEIEQIFQEILHIISALDTWHCDSY